MEETEAELVSALDSATTWSAYCENQLSAAATLTNAQEHPERVLRCVNEALFAASQVAAMCATFKALVGGLDRPAAPQTESVDPGFYQLDIPYCRKCNAQQLGDSAEKPCPKGDAHDWTRELPR